MDGQVEWSVYHMGLEVLYPRSIGVLIDASG